MFLWCCLFLEVIPFIFHVGSAALTCHSPAVRQGKCVWSV